MKNERDYINFSIDDRIALVMMDRPPVNAMNRKIRKEIDEVFEELNAISEIGAVIITSKLEKVFMAGADLEMMTKTNSVEAIELSTSLHTTLSKIEKSDKVVIAAINGPALGGGCEIALACDIRVIDESAIIGLPEVSLGFLPGGGGTQRLARLVGIGKAKELILTGDPVNADEAKRIGLAERIAPKGEAVVEAKKLAKRVLLRGPIAVANAKKAINQGMDMAFEDGLKRETELFSAIFETQDMKEGVKAFLEKRKPNFMGK